MAMNQREIARIITAYHKAKLAADDAKKYADMLKAEAKALGVNELEGGGFRVTIKDVTSTTFDSKAFKEAQPDLWTIYSKSTTTTRLYLK